MIMEIQYSTTRQIPSCTVGIALLKEIENYIVTRISEIQQRTVDDVQKNITITIRGADGSLQLESLRDYSESRLPDDTESVRIHYSNRLTDKKCELTIILNSSRYFTNIEMCVASHKPKKEIDDTILNIISYFKRYQSWNWLLHPPATLFIFLIPIFAIFSFIALSSTAVQGKFDALNTVAALALGP